MIRNIYSGYAEGIKPPAELTFLEWAERHVQVVDGENSLLRPGRGAASAICG